MPDFRKFIMEKDDLQKSKQDANNIGNRDKTNDEINQAANSSNNPQRLQAGLGRDRMKDAEDWNGTSEKSAARDFHDLKNENLNAANDE